jgi:hypothetical protein
MTPPTLASAVAIVASNRDVKKFSQIGGRRTLRYTGHPMKTVVAWLVATVCMLVLLAPTAAAPPEDVVAYCRATYPDVQFQVRCLDVERAAAERVSRSGPGADRGVFNRCLSLSPSWASMETCLAQSTRGGSVGGGPGVAAGTPSPAVDPAAPRPDPRGPAASPTEGAAAAPPPTPSAGVPPSSTVILGPQGAPSAERDRPTRPISEADADRHLRGILERTGNPTAHCTKKQYGPGWVIICE